MTPAFNLDSLDVVGRLVLNGDEKVTNCRLWITRKTDTDMSFRFPAVSATDILSPFRATLMQQTDLVTIATFATSHEAGIARAELEASGIEAFVNDAASNITLSHIGTALGGVKLQVNQQDAARAREELKSLDEVSDIPEWICSECNSEVDAGFQTCWSCGNACSPDQATASLDPEQSSETTNSVSLAGTEAKALTGLERTDDVAKRAWRAALLGVLFAPLLIYAIAIVLPLATEPRSRTATRKFYGTIIVTSLMIWIWYMMLTGPI